MKVSVFRLQLFKTSEGFISAQARALPTASPKLVGRKLFGPPDPHLPFWVPADLTGLNLVSFLLSSSPEPFATAIRAHGTDLIHAHFAVDGLYALAIAKNLNCPLITTLHGFDITTSRMHLLGSGRPALIRYAILQNELKKGGAHFVCVSKFMYETALRLGFPEKRMSVHYIGIDPCEFAHHPATQPPRFIHVARLVEKKGTSYLIDALARVARECPEVTLDIIGDGPLRSRLEAQASSLGVTEKITFHGAKPHEFVRQRLLGATALILPSVKARSGDAEGLGLVLLEASAAGVPVIGTRHGGIPEAVEDDVTGLLVPERSAEALADAIRTLFKDSGLQHRMGQAGRRMIVERFDIRRQSASLEELYQRVL